MDAAASSLTIRNATTVREGFRLRAVDDTPATITPCRECRALVLAEDMAEHRARAHDSYYPDPRPEWVEYTVAAAEVEDGDVILGDPRITDPVAIDWTTWGRLFDPLIKIYCLPDKGFLEFAPDAMLRVLRRDHD